VKKTLTAVSLAAAFAVLAPLNLTATGGASFYTSAVAADAAMDSETSMKRVNLIIRKLRDAMSSMNDLDELEKAGMSKRDVDRMRNAMNEKIKQMMDEAVGAIRNL